MNRRDLYNRGTVLFFALAIVFVTLPIGFKIDTLSPLGLGRFTEWVFVGLAGFWSVLFMLRCPSCGRRLSDTARRRGWFFWVPRYCSKCGHDLGA